MTLRRKSKARSDSEKGKRKGAAKAPTPVKRTRKL